MKLSVGHLVLLFVSYVALTAANPRRHQMRGDEELFMSTVSIHDGYINNHRIFQMKTTKMYLK